MHQKRKQEEKGRSPTAVVCGFAFSELPVIIAGLSLLLTTRIAARAEGSAEPAPMERAFAAIQECMTKSPPPWPEAWRREYADAIREVIVSHQDASQYAARLHIIRQGFPAYWEGLQKGKERSLFEVDCAEIRWFGESLLAGELAGETEKQKLRVQWRALMEDSAASLLTQFPFLDPNMVQSAKADYLAKCYRDIEAPLLPTLRHAFSEEQIGQLRERWHGLRYTRVDLWRQLVRSVPVRASPQERLTASLQTVDYLLTQRSLDQLRGQTWSLIGAFPDYYRGAVAKEIAAQRQRLQVQADARAQENRLGVAVWQTEYLNFLLAALLETADIPEGPTRGLGEDRGGALQGEIHEDR